MWGLRGLNPDAWKGYDLSKCHSDLAPVLGFSVLDFMRMFWVVTKKIHGLISLLSSNKGFVFVFYSIFLLYGLTAGSFKGFALSVAGLAYFFFMTRLYILKDLPFIATVSNHVPEESKDIVDYGFGLAFYCFNSVLAFYIYRGG